MTDVCIQDCMLNWIVIVIQILTDDTKNGQRGITEGKPKSVSVVCVKTDWITIALWNAALSGVISNHGTQSFVTL